MNTKIIALTVLALSIGTVALASPGDGTNRGVSPAPWVQPQPVLQPYALTGSDSTEHRMSASNDGSRAPERIGNKVERDAVRR